MEIENQVCSEEQANKLKELGVPQISTFYFLENYNIQMLNNITHTGFEINDVVESALKNDISNKISSAFNVAELGEILIDDNDMWFCDTHYNSHFGAWEGVIGMRDEDESSETYGGIKSIQWEDNEYPTEAECKADMLIYLIENKLLEVSQINEL